MDNEVVLKAFPVCDCGQVIKDLAITKYHTPQSPRGHKRLMPPSFEPERCPGCGRTITGVKVLNFDAFDDKIDFSRL